MVFERCQEQFEKRLQILSESIYTRLLDIESMSLEDRQAEECYPREQLVLLRAVLENENSREYCPKVVSIAARVFEECRERCEEYLKQLEKVFSEKLSQICGRGNEEKIRLLFVTLNQLRRLDRKLAEQVAFEKFEERVREKFEKHYQKFKEVLEKIRARGEVDLEKPRKMLARLRAFTWLDELLQNRDYVRNFLEREERRVGQLCAQLCRQLGALVEHEYEDAAFYANFKRQYEVLVKLLEGAGESAENARTAE